MHRLIAIAPGYNENPSPASFLHVVRKLVPVNVSAKRLGFLSLANLDASLTGRRLARIGLGPEVSHPVAVTV